MVESHCHCYKGGLFPRVYGEEHHCHTEWTVTNDILHIKPNIYIYIRRKIPLIPTTLKKEKKQKQ